MVNGERIHVLDVPDFTPRAESNKQLVMEIAYLLTVSRMNGFSISGVLWLQSFSAQPTDSANCLRLLELLCGFNNMRCLGLVSTNWDRLVNLDKERMDKIESSLCKKHWVRLLQHDAHTFRFSDGATNALQIMLDVLNRGKDPDAALSTSLKLCYETYNQRRTLDKTDLGRCLAIKEDYNFRSYLGKFIETQEHYLGAMCTLSEPTSRARGLKLWLHQHRDENNVMLKLVQSSNPPPDPEEIPAQYPTLNKDIVSVQAYLEEQCRLQIPSSDDASYPTEQYPEADTGVSGARLEAVVSAAGCVLM